MAELASLAHNLTIPFEPATAFHLYPIGAVALEIVEDERNAERRRDNPYDPTTPFLRVEVKKENPAKDRSRLVSFGRRAYENDILLPTGWTKNDQCHFDINVRSTEIVLHDTSNKGTTHLEPVSECLYPDCQETWKASPRQTVVLTDHVYEFSMGSATFHLHPYRPKTKSEKALFASTKMDYANQTIPEEYQKSLYQILDRFLDFDLTSRHSTVISHGYNTRVHPPTSHVREDIKYHEIGELGEGGQGSVNTVIDLHNEDLYARKLMRYTEDNLYHCHTESDFKKRIKKEIGLVNKKQHYHIVPYIHSQGFEIGKPIEIFMPLYEGDLLAKIKGFRVQKRDTWIHVVETMFHQILLALQHMHEQNPPILHRDVKPQNILWRGNRFLLTDFGCAKPADTNNTYIGTYRYMCPELWERSEQTTKVDIFAFGVTVLECFKRLPYKLLNDDRKKYVDALTHAAYVDPTICKMLAWAPEDRPSAANLLDECFEGWSHPELKGTTEDAKAPNLLEEEEEVVLQDGSSDPLEWTKRVSKGIFCGTMLMEPSQKAPPSSPSQSRPSQLPPTHSSSIRSSYLRQLFESDGIPNSTLAHIGDNQINAERKRKASAADEVSDRIDSARIEKPKKPRMSRRF